MDRAQANGYSANAEGWANLGQGAPEVGNIPGAHPKPTSIDLTPFGESVHEYAPTTGIPELRKAVAEYYNKTFRQGKKSQYTMDNVCIVPGGRAGLSRVASIIGPVNTGFQCPDYTAYSNLLGVFKNLVPIPTQLSAEDGYKLNVANMRREIRDRGLSAVLMSNPRNPTGTLVQGEELKEMTHMARQMHFSLILDEFYSWYLLEEAGEVEGEKRTKSRKPVSAAEFIEDVEEDPVFLIDGLTKNHRCPSWRVCWVVGPSDMIKALAETGSFLDGGANRILQAAAVPMLDVDRCETDRLALQTLFRAKRDHVLSRLEKMGFKIRYKPIATFYLWLDVGDLPAPLNSGTVFFEELLREKVIVTPGTFFDLNPSHRRNIIDAPCERFVRISYGPPMEELDRGLDGFERVVNKVRANGGKGFGKGYKRHDTK